MIRIVLLVCLLLSACAPATGGPAPVQDPAANANPEYEQAWRDLAEAARREGKVVVKGNPAADLRTEMPRRFTERFGVDMEYIATTSAEFAVQAEKERAAGIYSVDIVLGGAAVMYPTIYANGWLDPLKPIITHPDALDTTKWKGGRLWWMDPEQQYILRLANSVSQSVFINTNAIRPGEIKSWYDLLKPEYKGKMSINDPMAQGGGHLLCTILYMQLGEDFVRRLLTEQDVLMIRDSRQQADTLARGSRPIALAIGQDDYRRLKDDGLPVDYVGDLPEFPGYLSAGFAMMGLMNHAPHPNAAKLFANWLASKEGMEVLTRAADIIPVRTDIDLSGYSKEAIPSDGVAYIDSYDWDFAMNQRLPLGDKIRAMIR